MSKLLLFSFLLFSCLTQAQMDGAQPNPMQQTQDLLRDRAQREKAISETADAQKADARVKEQSPDQATQDGYYDLAAGLMENLGKDEDEMKKNISDAQRNPADFYEKMTPQQKQKVKELSEKLNPGAKPNP